MPDDLVEKKVSVEKLKKKEEKSKKSELKRRTDSSSISFFSLSESMLFGRAR